LDCLARDLMGLSLGGAGTNVRQDSSCIRSAKSMAAPAATFTPY
jgi:hypothetical protein